MLRVYLTGCGFNLWRLTGGARYSLPISSDLFGLQRNFNWDNFTREFAQKIEENTKGDLGDLMLSKFSTTNAVEASCSQIILMNQCKNYFEYKM